jgi:hypothetical protein
VKALRSSAAVIIRTAADDAAWVVECRAATEWLKQREAAAQAATGALEAVGSVPAAQGSEPSEVAAPSAAGLELRSTSTAQASIEAAEAEASVRNAGRADAEQEVVEVPPEAGQKAAQPEDVQPQRDQPAEPAVEVESGADAPLPVVPVVAPVVEVPAPAQGSTPALIDLTLDDSPVDKGKQVVGVEGAEATDQAGPSATVEGAEAADQAGPSAAPESDLAEAPAAWSELVGLALVRAERSCRAGGGRP